MFDTIPAGLDHLAPGPVLAALLSSIDVTSVSGYDRMVVLRAEQKMAAHYAARGYAAMASVVDVMEDDDPNLATESAAAEIRAALHLTRRAADSELGFALELRQRLPRVWELLAAGAIDVRRARTIAYGTAHLSDQAAREVIDRIIEEAPRLTTGQLSARLGRLCIEADPDEAQRRYNDAVADRRVVCEPTVAGTANLLGLDLMSHRAAAVARRINRIALSLKTATESRTIDQLRADAFLDLLTGKTRGGKVTGVVDIRVDLDTLTRLSDAPGELAGYGPVIADIARQVAYQQTDGEWRFVVTDPQTGLPVHNGITRRRPTTNQRRTVQTLDPTCVFPGCRMPAVDCDLDHRIPWSDGGPTTIANLAPLCRHDHRIRHHGWTHRPLPDGDHEWTSRLGHVYTASGIPP